jgi:hypothetical protein
MAEQKPFNVKLIIFAILFIVLGFTLYTPFLLINSDSVHGFDVMNGYYWTGKWNTSLQYNPATHHLYEKFLTWWSPGQWMVPMFFVKVLHVKIGTALVIINFLCTSLGTIGYLLVFKKYGFDRLTIWISVIAILLSSSVLPGYYDYAGGECLNFMIFPWIILMQKLLVQKTWKYIFPGFILFVAFVCKLQMLIVVPPLLFFLVVIQKEDLNLPLIRKPFRKAILRQQLSDYIPLFVSVIPVILFIYFGFISEGDTPAHSIRQVSLSPVNLFFPVASPVTSVYFFDSVHYYLSSRPVLESSYLIVVSVLFIAALLYVIRRFSEYPLIKKKYIFLALILYAVSVSVFIVLYVKGTPIDQNPRHLKLTSFLLYPVLVDLMLNKWKKPWLILIIFLLGGYALFNHARLVRTWNRGTSVTRSGHRMLKEDMPLAMKERIDSLVRVKTVVISPYESRYSVDNQLILPVLSKEDIRQELQGYGYPVIFTDSLR